MIKKRYKYLAAAVLLVSVLWSVDTAYKRFFHMDIMSYVDKYDVSFNVAKYRLDIQTDIGQLDSFLTEQYEESFAGLYIQHLPEYSVNILFNDLSNLEETRPLWSQKSWEKFVKVQSARYTLAELIQFQRELGKLLFDLNAFHPTSIDVINNRVVLDVLKQRYFEKRLKGMGLKLPEAVFPVVVRSLESAF